MQFEIWTKALCRAPGRLPGSRRPRRRRALRRSPHPSTCAAGKNSRGSSSAATSPPRPAKPGWSPTSKESAPNAFCSWASAPRPRFQGGAHAQSLAPGGVRRHWRPPPAPASPRSRSRCRAPPRRCSTDERLGRAVAEIAGHTLYRVNDLKSSKKPRAAGAVASRRRRCREGRAGHPARASSQGSRARRGFRADAQPRQPAGQCLHAHLPRQDGAGPGARLTNPCR